jgi:protein-tyrosine phosphatase
MLKTRKGTDMIDIHCHVLYGVDDGSVDLQISQLMIDQMAQMGVTAVIATPHYRRHMFSYPEEQIEEAYQVLREYAASKQISLFPRCEYHVDHDIFDHLETGRVHSLADTSYVLTEYSYSDSLDRILSYTQELILRGWKPVIAHAERYEVFHRKPRLAEEVVDAGAQIQVNANSILGLDGRAVKKASRKFLDLDLVSYIASDAHDLVERASHMGECFSFVRKKYGEEAAKELFEENPGRILRGE